MARKLKEYITRDLTRKIKVEDGFIAIDCHGLNAQQTFDLRKSVRESGGVVYVVPNRLALRVLGPAVGENGSNGQPGDLGQLCRGPTAIVLGREGGEDRVIALSRALVQWRKKNDDKIAIKGGYLSGALLDSRAVHDLATIPDTATLLGIMAGLFQAPLRDVVTVTQQTITRLVYALEAYREKLEKGGD